MPGREVGNEAETIIAASVKVEGDFTSQGNVLIEGVVEGSLKTERNLRVGEKAKINADVTAANATIAGEVRGNMNVTEKLELEPTARIFGDVKTKILTVSAGAEVNGRISMGQAAPGKNESAERAKPVNKIMEKAAAVQEKEKEPAASFFG
jgi:cytoskeletal protein CcmA (bactofilin family)